MDTTGIIYATDFSRFEEIVVPPEVVEEVKDLASRLKLASIKNIRVEEPSKESVEKVKEVAKKTGDLARLSQADLKVLALGYEKGYVVVSDDRNVQNICCFLGIRFLSIFSPRIRKKIVWKEYCDSCKRVFDVGTKVCPVCGRKLRRIRWRAKPV